MSSVRIRPIPQGTISLANAASDYLPGISHYYDGKLKPSLNYLVTISYYDKKWRFQSIRHTFTCSEVQKFLTSLVGHPYKRIPFSMRNNQIVLEQEIVDLFKSTTSISIEQAPMVAGGGVGYITMLMRDLEDAVVAHDQ